MKIVPALLTAAFGTALLVGQALPTLVPPAQAFEFTDLFGMSSDAKAEDLSALKREGVTLLDWDDLAPTLSEEAKAAAAELNARIDMMDDTAIMEAMAKLKEGGDEVVPALDGETVSIKGYLVPLDFDATTVKAFVLVPYMGACIHVPPPPPNQVVYVQFEEGVPMEELEKNFYVEFRVTGTLRASPATTELAEVGYQLTADRVGMVGS